MVGVKTFEDLRSFEIPILCVGDGFQLPPVSDDCKLFEALDAVMKWHVEKRLEMANFEETAIQRFDYGWAVTCHKDITVH